MYAEHIEYGCRQVDRFRDWTATISYVISLFFLSQKVFHWDYLPILKVSSLYAHDLDHNHFQFWLQKLQNTASIFKNGQLRISLNFHSSFSDKMGTIQNEIYFLTDMVTI